MSPGPECLRNLECCQARGFQVSCGPWLPLPTPALPRDGLFRGSRCLPGVFRKGLELSPLPLSLLLCSARFPTLLVQRPSSAAPRTPKSCPSTEPHLCKPASPIHACLRSRWLELLLFSPPQSMVWGLGAVPQVGPWQEQRPGSHCPSHPRSQAPAALSPAPGKETGWTAPPLPGRWALRLSLFFIVPSGLLALHFRFFLWASCPAVAFLGQTPVLHFSNWFPRGKQDHLSFTFWLLL